MNTRQLLRGPRRIDRRKTLPKVLLRPIEPHQKSPGVTRRPIAPRNIPPDPRRIRLQRRPIAPRLIQHDCPAQRHLHPSPGSAATPPDHSASEHSKEYPPAHETQEPSKYTRQSETDCSPPDRSIPASPQSTTHRRSQCPHSHQPHSTHNQNSSGQPEPHRSRHQSHSNHKGPNAPPRINSTSWIASVGISSQWIHPPYASFNGTWSLNTSVRLAAVEPSPRSVVPSVVGFATHELVLRNSWNPATCLNRSSSV